MKSPVLAAWLTAAVSASLLAGCGDDPGAPEGLRAQLEALDGVTVEDAVTTTPGYAYYVLWFTQPVDHADPGGQTFQQRVSLLHADPAAPMVALTTGYWDYYGDRTYELTDLLGANQISIEHRYFGDSRPAPADWSKLTVRAMADDQHRIIAALKTIYDGAFVTTGGSKGGMTAVYHRRFYPDDVEATVPYVAPLSLGAPDPRYAAFLDTIGTPSCRSALRAAATEMLQHRRAPLLAKAEAQAAAEGHRYTRIAIGPALEASIASFEWAFWQYVGAPYCGQVPGPAASDDQLWQFLDRVAPVSDNSDDAVAAFEAYYHQAYAQLGYPDAGAAYLDPFLQYTDRDYDGAAPTALPTYDGGEAMRDIDAYVQAEGSRLLFIYGAWDPWTGGKFELGAATDSLLLVQPEGAHAARIGRLAPADRDAALARLAAWTGVTPMPEAAARRAPAVVPAEPRVPPAIVRALRGRR